MRRSCSHWHSEAEAIAVSKIIADERTNSIIVLASRAGLIRIRSLIKKLDYELISPTGKIHVHYLENANAEELTETLSALTSAGAIGAATAAARPATADRRDPQPY